MSDKINLLIAYIGLFLMTILMILEDYVRMVWFKGSVLSLFFFIFYIYSFKGKDMAFCFSIIIGSFVGLVFLGWWLL